MTGYGISYGCVSVIDGIVTGIGAVIGTSLETAVEYKEIEMEQSVFMERE